MHNAYMCLIQYIHVHMHTYGAHKIHMCIYMCIVHTIYSYICAQCMQYIHIHMHNAYMCLIQDTHVYIHMHMFYTIDSYTYSQCIHIISYNIHGQHYMYIIFFIFLFFFHTTCTRALPLVFHSLLVARRNFVYEVCT